MDNVLLNDQNRHFSFQLKFLGLLISFNKLRLKKSPKQNKCSINFVLEKRQQNPINLKM